MLHPLPHVFLIVLKLDQHIFEFFCVFQDSQWVREVHLLVHFIAHSPLSFLPLGLLVIHIHYARLRIL